MTTIFSVAPPNSPTTSSSRYSRCCFFCWRCSGCLLPGARCYVAICCFICPKLCHHPHSNCSIKQSRGDAKHGQRQADVRNLFCVVGRRGWNDVDDVDAQRCLSSTGQPFVDKVSRHRGRTDGCDFDTGAGCRVAGARWWAGSEFCWGALSTQTSLHHRLESHAVSNRAILCRLFVFSNLLLWSRHKRTALVLDHTWFGVWSSPVADSFIFVPGILAFLQ